MKRTRFRKCGAMAGVVGAALLLLAAGDATLGPSAANTMKGPTGEPIAVDSAMFPNGGMSVRGFEVTQSVHAPVAAVYERFTTSAGWKKFLGAETVIDLRVGGAWEIYFGDDKIGSNGCQVLSYIPNEMVSFSWNAPPKFAERAQRTWCVVHFTKDGEGKTTIRFQHSGFSDSGNWKEVQGYFEKAWPNVLKALADSFEEPSK
ncbi:MAG: SRPBCC domain-containing protein [Phycisphaerales bacterium]|nr:SRPBCC domain-containing protein [Phycisphaerales bacterium]